MIEIEFEDKGERIRQGGPIHLTQIAHPHIELVENKYTSKIIKNRYNADSGFEISFIRSFNLVGILEKAIEKPKPTIRSVKEMEITDIDYTAIIYPKRTYRNILFLDVTSQRKVLRKHTYISECDNKDWNYTKSDLKRYETKAKDYIKQFNDDITTFKKRMDYHMTCEKRRNTIPEETTCGMFLYTTCEKNRYNVGHINITLPKVNVLIHNFYIEPKEYTVNLHYNIYPLFSKRHAINAIFDITELEKDGLIKKINFNEPQYRL